MAETPSPNSPSSGTSRGGYLWNGTAWIVAPGDAANGMDVDVTRLPSLPAGSNAIGSVSVSNFPGSQPVSGPLTDAQLRATAVPVSGSFYQATQPVSAAALPLPSGAAQEHATAGSPHSARLSDGSGYLGTTAGRLQVSDGGVALSTSDSGLGTDGSTPPSITGTGVRGWLRGIYEKLAGTLTVGGTVAVSSAPTTAVTGPLTDTQLRASSVPVSGTVTVSNPTTAPETGLAKDATLTGGTQKSKLVDSGGTNAAAVSAAGRLSVDGSGVTQPVSGTFWQTTQPVSLATNTPDVTDRSARLLGHVTVDSAPTTAVTGPLTDTQLRASAVPTQDARLPSALNADGGLPTHVQNFPATQAVSAASLPLPTGAAQDSTLTGGTVKAIARGGSKGATAAADVTSTPEGTDHQAQDVQLYHGGAAVNPQTIRALTSADVVTAAQGAAAGAGSPWTIRLSDGAAFYDGVKTGQLPAALGANGALKVEGVASGTAQPVSGPLTDTQLRASAVPVSGTFFQATQPVSLATNTPDVTDRAAREAGRVRLWDGTDEATVIPRGSAPTSADKALAVMPLASGRPVYQANSGDRTIPTLTAAAVDYGLTLWHPNTLTKDVFILEIGVNVRAVQTAGTFNFELSFISAENGTPGGSTVTAQPLNLGNAASGLTLRTGVTGAPTLTGQVFQRATFPLPAAATPLVGSSIEGMILFQSVEGLDDAIMLRSGQAEGLAIRTNVVAALTTAPIYNVYVRYVERA